MATLCFASGFYNRLNQSKDAGHIINCDSSRTYRHKVKTGGGKVSGLFLWFLCLSCFPHVCHCIRRDEFKPLKLYDDLFTNYSTYVKPRLDSSQAVDFDFTLNYVTLLSLDNLAQEMKSQLVISFVWRDELLTWNPQDYDNISIIYPTSDTIWHPIINVINSLDENNILSGKPEDLASAWFNGQVSWAATLNLHTRCSLDMSKFPFDVQICQLTLYMARPQNEMNMTQFQVYFGRTIQTNGEWLQANISGVLETIKFDQNFQKLEVYVEFRRLARYYVINVCAPMLLLSSLCNVVFLVSAESGDKLSVALTLLLSEAVFLSYTSSLMPKTSDELPMLTLYLLCLLVVNTLSILTTLFVLKTFKYSGKADSMKPPQVLKTVRSIFGPNPEVRPTEIADSMCSPVSSSKKEIAEENSTPAVVTSCRSLRMLPSILAKIFAFEGPEGKNDKNHRIAPCKESNTDTSQEREAAENVFISWTPKTGNTLTQKETVSDQNSMHDKVIPSMLLPNSTIIDLTAQEVCAPNEFCAEGYSQPSVNKKTSSKDITKPFDSTETENKDSFALYSCNPNQKTLEESSKTAASIQSASRKDHYSIQQSQSKAPGTNLARLAWADGQQQCVNSCQVSEFGSEGMIVDLDKDVTGTHELEWLLISRALDRMFFLVFNLVILSVTVFFFMWVD